MASIIGGGGRYEIMAELKTAESIVRTFVFIRFAENVIEIPYNVCVSMFKVMSI